jgi:hypothetical protein
MESLTTGPELENGQGHKRKSQPFTMISAPPLQADARAALPRRPDRMRKREAPPLSLTSGLQPTTGTYSLRSSRWNMDD